MRRLIKLTGISVTSAAAFVFALGLLLGSFKVPSYAAWSANRKLAAEAAKSHETFRLYRTADYATAKNALLEDIRRNDQLSAKCGKPQNMFAEDAMMDYARLAMLSERKKQPTREPGIYAGSGTSVFEVGPKEFRIIPAGFGRTYR